MEILNSAIGVGLDIILLLYMMKNYKYKFDKIFVIGYCLAYMISVIVLNKVMGSGIFRLPIYCFLVWLFITIFYEETTALLAVKLTVIYFVIMQVSEMFMLGCIIFLGDYSLYEEALQGDSVRTIFIILITKSISMVFAMLLGRLRSKKQQYIVSIAILFPLLVALLVLIINTKLLLEIKDDKLIINIICTMGLIMFVAMSYAMFFEYYEKAKEREKFIEKLVLQNKQQYKLFQEKMLNDQKIKKMYHDMKNHVLYLQYCFVSKDLEKGLDYSNNLLNQLSACNVCFHTGNVDLSCMWVNSKVSPIVEMNALTTEDLKGIEDALIITTAKSTNKSLASLTITAEDMGLNVIAIGSLEEFLTYEAQHQNSRILLVRSPIPNMAEEPIMNYIEENKLVDEV